MALRFDTHASRIATEAKISTDKNAEKYLGAVPVVVALIMKPIAASSAARQLNGPRTCHLSESQQKSKIVANDRTYGGAERPCDWTVEKVPISLMSVGRNNGSEAYETLQPK